MSYIQSRAPLSIRKARLTNWLMTGMVVAIIMVLTLYASLLVSGQAIP